MRRTGPPPDRVHPPATGGPRTRPGVQPRHGRRDRRGPGRDGRGGVPGPGPVAVHVGRRGAGSDRPGDRAGHRTAPPGPPAGRPFAPGGEPRGRCHPGHPPRCRRPGRAPPRGVGGMGSGTGGRGHGLAERLTPATPFGAAHRRAPPHPGSHHRRNPVGVLGGHRTHRTPGGARPDRPRGPPRRDRVEQSADRVHRRTPLVQPGGMCAARRGPGGGLAGSHGATLRRPLPPLGPRTWLAANRDREFRGRGQRVGSRDRRGPPGAHRLRLVPVPRGRLPGGLASAPAGRRPGAGIPRHRRHRLRPAPESGLHRRRPAVVRLRPAHRLGPRRQRPHPATAGCGGGFGPGASGGHASGRGFRSAGAPSRGERVSACRGRGRRRAARTSGLPGPLARRRSVRAPPAGGHRARSGRGLPGPPQAAVDDLLLGGGGADPHRRRVAPARHPARYRRHPGGGRGGRGRGHRDGGRPDRRTAGHRTAVVRGFRRARMPVPDGAPGLGDLAQRPRGRRDRHHPIHGRSPARRGVPGPGRRGPPPRPRGSGTP